MSEDSNTMTSHRPYLLRALYEWIADNGMTPHLLVDATRPGVQVPAHAVNDGRIVLNVAERAVSRLQMDNDLIRFSARFGGVSHAISVPVGAVLAIYSRETGQGMALPDDGLAGDAAEATEAGEDDFDATPPAVRREGSGPVLAPVPDQPAPSTEGNAEDASGDDDGPAPPPRRGPNLRIVK